MCSSVTTSQLPDSGSQATDHRLSRVSLSQEPTTSQYNLMAETASALIVCAGEEREATSRPGSLPKHQSVQTRAGQTKIKKQTTIIHMQTGGPSEVAVQHVSLVRTDPRHQRFRGKSKQDCLRHGCHEIHRAEVKPNKTVDIHAT